MLADKVLFKTLDRTHTDYEYYKQTWQTISEIRDGAPAILKNIEAYLPKKPDESPGDYKSRLAKFAYTPVFATAIKDTAAKLAASPIYVNTVGALDTVMDYIREHNDAKGKRDERTLVQDIFLELLYYGRVHLVADRPGTDVLPRSKGEESGLGLPYLNMIPILNVIDWSEDDDWYKTREIVEVKTPTELAYNIKYTYYLPGVTVVYEAPCTLRDGALWQVWNGSRFVPWATPTLTLDATFFEHQASSSLVTAGTLPSELWVGAMCYLKQIQHMSIESSWSDSGSLAGTIQRVFTPTPAVANDNPSYLQSEPEYDKVLLGNRQVLVGNGFQFVESTGAAIKNLTEQLHTIESQIKAIVSMRFATSETTVMAQSGLSKMADQMQLINTMRDYGNRVRSIYQDALQSIVMLLGRDAEELSVQGLNDFDTEDVKEGLLNGVSVAGLAANIPLTAQRLFWQKISKQLTGTVSPEDEDMIRQELLAIFDPNNQGISDGTIT
jgi:hypothetical protein